MTVRFQADNDLDQRIVKATCQFDPSVDFQTAFQAKLHGIADPLVLEIAASENRILVSRDRRTMPGHFAKFVGQHSSPGVILLSRKLSISQSAEWLYLVWSASGSEEYANIIFYIP